MNYDMVEKSMQVLFEQAIPLKESQRAYLRELVLVTMLAGSSHLSQLAKWLPHETQQDSRIQWIRRVLERDYLQQKWSYRPFVKEVLRRYQADELHVVMDRSPLPDKSTDLLSVNLSFRKRAIPLVWEFMPHGMSGLDRQKRLIQQCEPLLPHTKSVIFHGDNEFGGVPLIQYLRQLGWDVIVGVSGNTCYQLYPQGGWRKISSLPVTKSRSVRVEGVELTKEYGYGILNLFGFYKPRFTSRHRKQNKIYCATSLPTTRNWRRIGRRRWGIECCFKDFKSAGWQLHQSQLCHPKRREGLMSVLSLAYLWATCIGRWLCKTGKRAEVDSKPQRHLSLFRIGWDWLVHRYRTRQYCPTLLTLYQ